MENHSESTRRIANNTLMLYVRMLFSMMVSLYTSRVILNALGVEDYGIYNAVGGFVAMFSIISGSLSSAVSRFLTFELGKGDRDRLGKVFSTSLSIHAVLALMVVVVAETAGVWFLNTKMTIPEERLTAANWVFQASLLSFTISTLCVPFNASIISHERMKAFAYIGILEVMLKLLIVLFIAYSGLGFDRLIAYSVLLVAVSLSLQGVYLAYCRRNFEECRLRLSFDRECWKEIGSFAGWNFLGSSAYILNTQGVNVLMNIYFGVAVNAARGIAGQVDGVLKAFVSNFTAAVNPQITKSYASGDLAYMHRLICLSARFSAFILLILAVPVTLEASCIMHLWLGNVPDRSVTFLRWIITSTFVDNILANSLVTAMLATGDIKKYQITVTAIGFLVFPLSWLAFRLGFPPETSYAIYFAVYSILLAARLILLKGMIMLSPGMYVKEVLLRVVPVTIVSFLPPMLIVHFMESSLVRLVLTCAVSIPATIGAEYCLGMTAGERKMIKAKACAIAKNLFSHAVSK